MFELLASLFITLYLAFFLIRDGDLVVRKVRWAIPRTEHAQVLVEKFTTVKGNLLVAAIQGALAFRFLGGPCCVAFLSLLPAIGRAHLPMAPRGKALRSSPMACW